MHLIMRFHNLRYPALSLVSLLLLFFTCSAFPQGSYRTFTQDELSLKKTNAGKITSSRVTFRFYNQTAHTANSLHLKLNANVLSIPDSGGFTTFAFNRKDVTVTGKTVPPGDSADITFISSKKAPGTQVSKWYWDSSGVVVGNLKNGPLTAMTDIGIPTQPNGGNVLEFIYKKVLTRPAGLVIGIEEDTPATLHWIRYMKADRKYFVHTGPAGCFSFVMNKHELKNPHVSKFDDVLLGDVHALKLAIIASDSGVTQPDMPANRLGDLLYNDPAAPSDPLNGMTVRAITRLIDSALTFCGITFPATYGHLDTVAAAINAAFSGPYVAVTFSPFKLAGTRDLATVPFLHSNPSVAPVAARGPGASIIDEQPQRYALYQNYPNPFNPSTTIRFDLPAASQVTLKVYNLLGQEVATLVNQEMMDGGAQQVVFDASGLASGLYIYRLTAGSFIETKKMVLMK